MRQSTRCRLANIAAAVFMAALILCRRKAARFLHMVCFLGTLGLWRSLFTNVVSFCSQLIPVRLADTPVF